MVCKAGRFIFCRISEHENLINYTIQKKKIGNTTFQVHTGGGGVTRNNTVFLGVMPYSMPPSFTLKMKAICCSETLIYFCFTIPHGFTPQATVIRKSKACEMCKVHLSYSKIIGTGLSVWDCSRGCSTWSLMLKTELPIVINVQQYPTNDNVTLPKVPLSLFSLHVPTNYLLSIV